MKTFKILIPTILLIATTTVMAGVFDKIGDFLDTNKIGDFLDTNKIGDFLDTKPLPWDKDLPIDTITISDYKYTNSKFNEFFSGPHGTDFNGRVYNNSSKITVNEVNIKFTILECNSRGENCTTIDEDTITISRKIPPQQARYFYDTIYYQAERDENIYYRFTVTSVKAK